MLGPSSILVPGVPLNFAVRPFSLRDLGDHLLDR